MAANPHVFQLHSGQQPEFGELWSDTRRGFRDALDLVLIHNEKNVRGEQPRAVLNPLTVLLAVAAWERFVVNVEALGARQWQAPGLHKKANEIAYLGRDKAPAKSGRARDVLAGASGGRLPVRWVVRSFGSWTGKSPRTARDLDAGHDMTDLAEQADAGIRLRNSVAHRCMAQDGQAPYWDSDADTHTIQAGSARAILAFYLQLTDQALVTLADAAGFLRPEEYCLPEEWFLSETPAGVRGVEKSNVLWGGYELIHSSALP